MLTITTNTNGYILEKNETNLRPFTYGSLRLVIYTTHILLKFMCDDKGYDQETFEGGIYLDGEQITSENVVEKLVPVFQKVGDNQPTPSNINHNDTKNRDDINAHPISSITDLESRLGSKADLENGKVPASQLPAFVDDIIEGLFISDTEFEVNGEIVTPESGKLYLDTSTNKVYRWSGSQYVHISSPLALGETLSTAYYGDKGKTAYDHSQTIGNPHGTNADQIQETATRSFIAPGEKQSIATAYTHSQITSGNPHNVTKSDVGLGNVDNTSDLNKPVSTAQQTAITNAETFDYILRFDKTGLNSNIADGVSLNILSLLSTSDISLSENKPISEWNLNAGILKFPLPKNNPYVDYRVTVRLTGTISGALNTSREFSLILKRGDDSKEIGRENISKVVGNSISARSKTFDTYTITNTDPFILTGIKLIIENNSGQTINLTELVILIKGITK